MSKRVLILVNRDFALYNFRVELVERLLKDGCEVYISLPDGEKTKLMVDMGCKHIDTYIDRRGTNPIKDYKLLRFYKRIMKEIKPDIVLTYTTKCCVYGGIAAGSLKIPYIVNVSGLGTAVENPGLLQKLMVFLYKWSVKKARCVFFQNSENQKFFEDRKMLKGKYRLIPGSGVNVDRFTLMDYPTDESIEFLFVARVIKEKGIEEYLKMAETIHGKYANTVFHVMGPCDGEYKDVLKDYENRGIIKYHGYVSDTREFLRNAHCTVHPSFYPEGISNVLLESEACGRPIITTNRSGCRETVEDGVTGYMFEPRDTEGLIACVERFVNLSNEEKKNMGLAAREKVCREFNRQIVVEAYVEEMEL